MANLRAGNTKLLDKRTSIISSFAVPSLLSMSIANKLKASNRSEHGTEGTDVVDKDDYLLVMRLQERTKFQIVIIELLKSSTCQKNPSLASMITLGKNIIQFIEYISTGVKPVSKFLIELSLAGLSVKSLYMAISENPVLMLEEGRRTFKSELDWPVDICLMIMT
ncbi:hypothetical protein BpHYR1_007999 [Brachionus plicatilis]|uniref:Uncharacterized protein n=1 Tax=Brachionus plicatilis TaxID=10195 RepID=A0A3M7R355_BRAPC|nr:hypothetical protein BpHYR1_007999 [Brachionus plicatilis]